LAHDVFISYSHEDKTIADAVCARLEVSDVGHTDFRGAGTGWNLALVQRSQRADAAGWEPYRGQPNRALALVGWLHVCADLAESRGYSNPLS